MRAKEFVAEASGYIPKNDEEAHDPRWEMAMTHDVKPGEDVRQAAKLGWKMGKDGKPLKMAANGKIEEAMMDVAVQGRMPVSAGSRGLMLSRADFGSVIHDNTNIMKGAVDELASQLSVPADVDQCLQQIVARFQVKDTDLVHAFQKEHGMRPAQYARKQLAAAKHGPMKI